jgi:hypothetical protein
MKRIYIVFLVLIMVLVMGCSGKSDGGSSTDTAGSESSYPSADSTSSYPAPGSNELTVPPHTAPEAFSMPEPAKEKAVITGLLYHKPDDGSDYRSLPNTVIFLGKVIQANDGIHRIGSLNKDEDPSYTTHADGRFVFTDVEPGTFTLFLYDGLGVYVIKDPNTNTDILLTLNIGDAIDLGIIKVDFQVNK